MTKKDYELIAGVFKYTQPNINWFNKHQQWRWNVTAMSETLAKNNPLFDKDKFLQACEYTDQINNGI